MKSQSYAHSAHQSHKDRAVHSAFMHYANKQPNRKLFSYIMEPNYS